MSKKYDIEKENQELKKCLYESATEHCHAYCTDKFMLKIKSKKCGNCFARHWWAALGDYTQTGNRNA